MMYHGEAISGLSDVHSKSLAVGMLGGLKYQLFYGRHSWTLTLLKGVKKTK